MTEDGRVIDHLDETSPTSPGVSSKMTSLDLGRDRVEGSSPECRCLATLAVHAGEREDRLRTDDAVNIPIVQTSTYFFKNTAEVLDYQEGRGESCEYGRFSNPTTRALENKIMALEGAEDCLVTSSGMNSTVTLLLALVPAGGHIVTTTDCYKGVRQFIQKVMPKMGVESTAIDGSDYEALEQVLKAKDVSLFLAESPTNPLLRCVDLQRIAALCHQYQCLMCIDSTFATPVNQRPLALGVDLVIHSATKYLGGHADVLAGCVAGTRHLVGKVRDMHKLVGGVPDPHSSYLVLRGMKTLHLRVQRQNATAFELARRLENHPKIARVIYPGLKSHPDHHVAARQMTGFGGVLSFEVDGDFTRTAQLIDGLQLPYLATSLGGVETLVEQVALAVYWDCTPEERAQLGIKDSLVRYSCGVEDVEDLWADLEHALDKI